MANVTPYTGVWARTHLFEPKDVLLDTDATTSVLWMQSTYGPFIDIRTPVTVDDGSNQSLGRRRIKSFAGSGQFEAATQVFTWTRHIDYRTPGTPDLGLMVDLQTAKVSANNSAASVMRADSAVGAGATAGRGSAGLEPGKSSHQIAVPLLVQEDSVLPGDDYREIWKRLDDPCSGVTAAGSSVVVGQAASSTAPGAVQPCALKLTHNDDASRIGYFLVVGNYWGVALGRAPLPVTVSLSIPSEGPSAPASVTIDDDVLRRHFAGEPVLGTQGSDNGKQPSAEYLQAVEAFLDEYLACVGTVPSPVTVTAADHVTPGPDVASTAGTAAVPAAQQPTWRILHSTRQGLAGQDAVAVLPPVLKDWRVTEVLEGSAPVWLAAAGDRQAR